MYITVKISHEKLQKQRKKLKHNAITCIHAYILFYIYLMLAKCRSTNFKKEQQLLEITYLSFQHVAMTSIFHLLSEETKQYFYNQLPFYEILTKTRGKMMTRNINEH